MKWNEINDSTKPSMVRRIAIDTVSYISKLNELALKCDCDVTVSKDKYVVDAKSLMGLLSIDLSTGCYIEYEKDNETCAPLDELCNLLSVENC